MGFFENYDVECATVHDSGCGQGRDALFIARKGHSVLGVDTAQTGIEQMLEEAESEKLAVDGVNADITNYEAPDLYNIVVILTGCFICYRLTKYAMRFLKNQ